MPQVAFVSSEISHGGFVVQGSPNVTANGLAVSRMGDQVICDLHGSTEISGGSATVFANGKPVARVGDPVLCGAHITTGSPNVFAGG